MKFSIFSYNQKGERQYYGYIPFCQFEVYMSKDFPDIKKSQSWHFNIDDTFGALRVFSIDIFRGKCLFQFCNHKSIEKNFNMKNHSWKYGKKRKYTTLDETLKIVEGLMK